MLNKIKTYFPKTRSRFLVFIILGIILVCAVTTGAVYDVTSKKIRVHEVDIYKNSDVTRTLRTRQETVEGFLEERDLSVSEYDKMNVSKSDLLIDGMELNIRRGVPVTVVVRGEQKLLSATSATVEEMLAENNILTAEADEITPARGEAVISGMTVTVVSVTSDYVVETTEIPFETVEQEDASLYKGEKKVVTEGVNGTLDTMYHIVWHDGAEISREAVGEAVTLAPVNKVVSVGTKEKVVAVKASTEGAARVNLSSRGDMRYKKKLTVTATAYDTSPAQNGGHSKTALGMTPRFGIVAVDPRVIPLGSRLYVESVDEGGSWVYGYAIAGDTGGAIKGNRIDLCYNTNREANAFGRRSATVYVLE